MAPSARLHVWMIAGILLGAAIEAIVPKEVVTTYLGNASLFGVLVALVIAGAFYRDSLASLPWVRTLLDEGLGAGSGMILLVAGGGDKPLRAWSRCPGHGVANGGCLCGKRRGDERVLGYLLNRLL